MPASSPLRRRRRAAIAPYSAPSGLNTCDFHDGGRYQKAGSRIGGSLLQPQLQQIGLERGQRALQRAAKLLDDALRRGELLLARRRIRQQLAELAHQRLLAIDPA